MSTGEYTADELEELLEEAGHLHLFLDSGAEAKVSNHDTEFTDSRIVVDSEEGYWEIPVSKVEYPDKEPSEVTPRAQ